MARLSFSMSPNPEGFGSNLSRNIRPNATNFSHVYLRLLTYLLEDTCTYIFLLIDMYPDFTNKDQNGQN